MSIEAPWTEFAPASWLRTYLGNVVDVRSGATPSKDDDSYWEGNIPWVSPKDMKVHRLADSEDHVSESAVTSTSLKWIPAGSVLMVIRGMILDHTVPVAVTSLPLTINQDMKALLPRPGVNSEFLAWLLVGLNPALLARVEEAAHGTKALRTEQWKKLPITLPPEPIQQRVSGFLEKKTAAIDELIARKERLLSLLREKRESLVEHAMTDRDGCEWRRIGFVADQIRRSIHRVDEQEYEPVGLYNWGRGMFHKGPCKGDDLGDSSFFWIESDDLVISGQFAWEGSVAVAQARDHGCVASHRYHILRGRPGILETAYPLAVLRTDMGHFLLNENSRGAAGRNRPLNIGALLKEKIPVPSLGVQKRVAQLVYLEERLKEVTDRYTASLNEYRQALITAAVTGHLDVSSADVSQEALEQAEAQAT